MARKLTVVVVGDTSDLQRSFGRASRSAKEFERDLSKSVRGAIAGSGAFKSLGRSIAFASAGFLGGVGVTAGIKDILKQASIIQEETEKTGVVFGKSAKEVQAWAKTLATSFGVSEGAALAAAGVFGNMFHSLHIGQADAATMSKRLVQLAADMASFNNASPEDTLAALQSGLAGQVRPLRQFGVFLSQDRIKAEALSSGIAKNAAHLSAAQKVQAAYNIILKDTAIQQGDVARNTESQSVAQSKLEAALRNSEAVIGKALLPSEVKLTNAAADYITKLEKSGRLQRDVNIVVKDAGDVVHGLADAFRDIRAVVGPLNDQLGGTKNTIKLLVLAFAGLKLAKLATQIRGIATAWGLVGKQARIAAGAQAVAAGGGGGLSPAGIPTRDLRAGAGATNLLRGGLLLPGAAGAASAFAQRGEQAIHLGGPLDVFVGPGDIVAYRDPVTGKHILVGGFRGKGTKALEAFLRADILKRHPELKRPPQLTGEDVAQRGAGARQQTGRGAGAGGGGGGGRLGLIGRFAKLELRLAQASLTERQADDRKILQLEAANLEEQLRTRKLSLSERTALTVQLAAVDGQIAAIDQQAAADRQAAAEKLLATHQEQLDRLRSTEARLKAKIASIQSAFKSAVDTAREGIGDLFAGPVLQPSDDARRRTLGLGRPLSSNAAKLTADLKAQVKQFAAFQKDLNTLAKRGAPAELIKELRAQGISAAPEAHALATAGKGTLTAFLKEFGKRERLAITTARTVMRAQLVTLHADRVRLANVRERERPIIVEVNLDKKQIARVVTNEQQRSKKGTAAQRSGRNAGVNQ